MKSIIFAMLMAVSASAFAQESILKECSIAIEFEETPNNALNINVKIYSDLTAVMTRSADGQSETNPKAKVILSEETVRTNLSAETNPDGEKLNIGERYVVHAMVLEEFGNNAGLDLKKVRSVKVYKLQDTSSTFGSASVIEARDANKKLLGSFLDVGLFVGACQ